ncbi:HAD hydrolase family protein [bacterium]|nr:HAD hydrolase family protein [bacterium]
MIAFDVDGVFTGGDIILGGDGNEYKRFNVQDGMGITLARQAGLKTAVITGRTSEAVTRRAGELRIDAVYQGAGDKLTAWNDLLDSFGLEPRQICYMGDDLLDLTVMRSAGLAAAPANARQEVKDAAQIVTAASGGEGAVRELVEFILKEQGLWTGLLTQY